MFVVCYVKKKMSAFYSCFDFEQILFPVQLNLCTWLACSFSPATTFSGDPGDIQSNMGSMVEVNGGH